MILSMMSILAISHYQHNLSNQMRTWHRSLLGFMKHVLLFGQKWSHYPPTSCKWISIARTQNSNSIQFSILKFHQRFLPQNSKTWNESKKKLLAFCGSVPQQFLQALHVHHLPQFHQAQGLPSNHHMCQGRSTPYIGDGKPPTFNDGILIMGI